MAINPHGTTDGLTGNSFDVAQLTAQQIEAEVQRLTGGVDYSGIKLDKNRGGKLFAVVFGADNKPMYVEDEDDGSKQMLKLVGDSGWQFVDALWASMKKYNAPKFMAWKWSDEEKRYLPARTRTDKNGKKIGDEGIIDHLIRRKSTKVSTVSVYPGVTELGLLSKKCETVAAKAKKAKGVYEPDDKSNVTKLYIAFLKSTGTTPQDALKLFRAEWSELFEKPKSEK